MCVTHRVSRSQMNCDGTRAETRFRLSAKRTSPFKSAGASVQSTTGSRRVRISGSNAGYTMFRGSVKGTGYWSTPFCAVSTADRSERNHKHNNNNSGSNGRNAGYTMFRGSVKGTGYWSTPFCAVSTADCSERNHKHNNNNNNMTFRQLYMRPLSWQPLNSAPYKQLFPDFIQYTNCREQRKDTSNYFTPKAT